MFSILILKLFFMYVCMNKEEGKRKKEKKKVGKWS